jgi:hypothetical protein
VIARLPGPKSSTVTLDDRFGKMGNFRRTTAFSEANLNLRNIYLEVGIPLPAQARRRIRPKAGVAVSEIIAKKPTFIDARTLIKNDCFKEVPSGKWTSRESQKRLLGIVAQKRSLGEPNSPWLPFTLKNSPSPWAALV